MRNNQNKSLVVAVSFDDQTESLVQSAVKLCERTGWELCLAHVSDVAEHAIWPGEIYGSFTVSDLMLAGAEASRADFQSRLELLASSCSKKIKVHAVAEIGETVSSLLSIAEHQNAQLILCGATKGKYWYVPKFFSHVLSLMAESPIPVLVVNEGSQIDWDAAEFKIAILDDLDDRSAKSFQHGYEMMKELSTQVPINILHSHVSGIDKQTLSISLKSAVASSVAGSLTDQNVDDIFESLEKKSQNRLLERAKSFTSANENKQQVHYESQVLYGSVGESIDSIKKYFNPQILCFGKHHNIHKKPFGIGRVAYSSMLEQKLPVLVFGS
jgi:nucleotide-binding universal stress UspA family protein